MITFEDGTRINFNGEEIEDWQPGQGSKLRHRHLRLIEDIHQTFRDYYNEYKPKTTVT